MDTKNKIVTCKVMYFVIFIIVSIPLANNYVMAGGSIQLWIARIEEVKEFLIGGRLAFFPSFDTITTYGGQATALNSNLWFLLPAFIRILGGSTALAYRVFMLLVQLGTLLSAKLMFERLFEEKFSIMFGVLFYLTCPYRIYICYDVANLSAAVVWMLLPVLIWGLLGINRSKKGLVSAISVSIAFAGIGYADNSMAVIMLVLIVFGCICLRKISSLLPTIVGIILCLPGALPYIEYIVSGGLEDFNIPLNTISNKGYAVGRFFTSFAYTEGRPGLGLGLLGALTVLCWLYFTKGKQGMNRKMSFLGILALILLFASTTWFPWDIIQRLGLPFLRMVGMFSTPTIFFGLASSLLCIQGAFAMEKIMEHTRIPIKAGIPIMVLFASLGVAVYICNTLTYTRLPLFY